jgi:hypothetical protein
MYQDPIVEEIRYYRKKHSEKHNNNLDKIFESLKKVEQKSNRKRIHLGPKELLLKTGT